MNEQKRPIAEKKQIYFLFELKKNIFNDSFFIL